MKNVIELNLGSGYEYSIRPYATCQSSANTQTKAVNYVDFNIVNGATIAIKFTKGNTYAGNTINEDNIKLKINEGLDIQTDCDYVIPENGIQEFIYDNGTWRAIGKPGEALISDIEGLFRTK